MTEDNVRGCHGAWVRRITSNLFNIAGSYKVTAQKEDHARLLYSKRIMWELYSRRIMWGCYKKENHVRLLYSKRIICGCCSKMITWSYVQQEDHVRLLTITSGYITVWQQDHVRLLSTARGSRNNHVRQDFHVRLLPSHRITWGLYSTPWSRTLNSHALYLLHMTF